MSLSLRSSICRSGGELCACVCMCVGSPWLECLSTFMSVVTCMRLYRGLCQVVYSLCVSMYGVFARQ